MDSIITNLSTQLEQLMPNSLGPGYRFPWESLEVDIESGKIEDFCLVGYGSLLNPDSARRTIPSTPLNGHRPIIAFGAKRIFNYRIPDDVLVRYGVPESPIERAALNVEWTGRSSDIVTGRLLIVPRTDLDDLRNREKGYHLDPVLWVPWDNLDSEPKRGFVLCADRTPVDGQVFVDNTLLPFLPYVDVCRDGARRVDSEFERMFLETSLLADGRTLLTDYLAKT